MRVLFGLLLCVSLMLWTSNDAYARGGTYHHAEFVPFRSEMAAHKSAPAIETHQHRRFTGKAPHPR